MGVTLRMVGHLLLPACVGAAATVPGLAPASKHLRQNCRWAVEPGSSSPPSRRPLGAGCECPGRQNTGRPCVRHSPSLFNLFFFFSFKLRVFLQSRAFFMQEAFFLVQVEAVEAGADAEQMRRESNRSPAGYSPAQMGEVVKPPKSGRAGNRGEQRHDTGQAACPQHSKLARGAPPARCAMGPLGLPLIVESTGDDNGQLESVRDAMW